MQMENGNITEKLFQRTMVTMMIAELSGAVSAAVDGVMIGQLIGRTGLAAFGVAQPYFSIASIISGVLVVGSTSMCTCSIGKGDTGETSRIFSLTIFLGILLSAGIAVFGSVFSGKVASLFGAVESAAKLHKATDDFLRGVLIGAPGFIMYVVLTPLLQLDGDSIRPRVAGLVCAVVDIAGDLLAVKVFNGGMFGIGLASAISHYAELAVVLSHFFKKSSLFRFAVHKIDFSGMWTLVREGLSRAACMAGRSLLPVLMNTLVLKLAFDDGVAAMSAQNTSSYIVGALGWGIGGAMLIVGGMMAGEQDVTGLKTAVLMALKDIVIGVGLLAVLVYLFSPMLATLFVPEAGGAQQMAVTAIRCYAVSLPFLAFNVVSANYFQATERSLVSIFLNIGMEVLFVAAAGYTLSMFLGVNGVWLAYPTGQALLTLIILAASIKSRRRDEPRFVSYMMLPENFGVSDEDCMECSVNTVEGVTNLSQEVSDFCSAHGIEIKRVNRLALCIEELGTNVILHGFSDGMPHHLEIRVLVKDGSIILRFRDDCQRFDLKEKAREWSFDEAHPEKNIGIRLVMGMASDIAYTNTMGTNNLIITI